MTSPMRETNGTCRPESGESMRDKMARAIYVARYGDPTNAEWAAVLQNKSHWCLAAADGVDIVLSNYPPVGPVAMTEVDVDGNISRFYLTPPPQVGRGG